MSRKAARPFDFAQGRLWGTRLTGKSGFLTGPSALFGMTMLTYGRRFRMTNLSNKFM